MDLTANRLLPAFRAERNRMNFIDRALRMEYAQGEQLRLPSGATSEHRDLRNLAPTPILQTVITTLSQGLFVDGFRSDDEAEDDLAWATWQANDFDTRQTAIHRAALSYGVAYATATPGISAEGAQSVLRGVSPRQMFALYADPAEDDWPMFAIRVEPSGSKQVIRVYDEENVYFLAASADGQDLEFVEYREHGSGVCPVVRFTNLLDLDGRADGEVAPLLPTANRFRKTTYDRLLAQHFNSWKVRTIAGLDDFADNETDADRKKLKLRQDDILVAEDPDTKFGTLDETPLAPYIAAAQQDIADLSAAAQIPATAFHQGDVANISADAIAELRAGLNQKMFERKVNFGKSHTQLLRLAARQEGREVSPLARVTWQDMSPRTISQVVDALVKMVQGMEVPPEAVIGKVPGFTKSDVEDIKSTMRGRSAVNSLRERLQEARAATGQRGRGELG